MKNNVMKTTIFLFVIIPFTIGLINLILTQFKITTLNFIYTIIAFIPSAILRIVITPFDNMLLDNVIVFVFTLLIYLMVGCLIGISLKESNLNIK